MSLKTMIQKMRIDGSVLLPCVNTLFESNRFHSSTKSHDIRIDDAQLSILAASTLDTYRNMFTSQFLDIGFVNRLFLVIGNSRRRFAIPALLPEDEKAALKGRLKEILEFVGKISANGRYAMPIDPDGRAIFQSWYLNMEQSPFSKRLDTYGHRNASPGHQRDAGAHHRGNCREDHRRCSITSSQRGSMPTPLMPTMLLPSSKNASGGCWPTALSGSEILSDMGKRAG